jgi:chaperonin GroES
MSTATKAKKKPASGSINLQPLGDRVVVEREESESRTAGGIVLPDTAKNKPSRGKVLSVGDGKLLDDGTRSKLQVRTGDRVLFSSYAGDEFKLGDRELLLMREEDILAVFED